ncbi:MAG: hypothetical protein Q9214_004166, partial [Letrouitia sp. 1 TL-2023]
SFFRQENRPSGFDKDNDIFQALYELASAIEAVHDYFSEPFNLRKIGCHYDLKPENILYRSGKLILSDFGLSRLGEEKDGSKSLHRNGGGEYMAPECVSVQDGFRSLRVGRSSDMWSFGCILSEMLTYLQEGPRGILEFSERRIIVFAGYWTCKAFHGGDRPHGGVVDWLDRLKSATTVEAQARFMTTVQDLLNMEPPERPKANELTLRLFYIAQHELYAIIDDVFQSLLAVPDLELQVEYERFRLWGENTGVKDDLGSFLGLKHQNQWKKFADLQMVRESLCKLRLESERLSRALESTNPKKEGLFFHLQKVIDDLWDMQSSPVRLSMTNELESRLLNTDEKAQLEAIEATFRPTETTIENSLAKVDGRMRAAYRRIGLLATMKKVASGLESTARPWTDMQLNEKFIKRPLTGFHWHHTGTYQPPDNAATQVLIEHLEYDSSWADRTDELIQRVQDIALSRSISFTKSAFPVLTCAGFYHDFVGHMFHIAYQFPTRPVNPPLTIPDVETPISLRDILLNVKSRRDRPSLDHVFAIASKLISIVVTMHKASWLHKNISSFNIIFFPDRFASTAEAMTSPWFIGFNHSRLDLELSHTQPFNEQLEYQHPEYLKGRKRFCQEYEYYSVGLVLLELGFWVPLAEICAKIPGSPEQLRQTLIKTWVPILKTYMGDAYAEAVNACLIGDFGGSLKPAEVRMAFERKVLQRVNKEHV